METLKNGIVTLNGHTEETLSIADLFFENINIQIGTELYYLINHDNFYIIYDKIQHCDLNDPNSLVLFEQLFDEVLTINDVENITRSLCVGQPHERMLISYLKNHTNELGHYVYNQVVGYEYKFNFGNAFTI